jgi:hypothetical protein
MDRSADHDLAELLEPPPTTLAGARAVIARRVEFDERSIAEASGEYLRPWLRSPISRLIRPRGAYRQAVGIRRPFLLRDK